MARVVLSVVGLVLAVVGFAAFAGLVGGTWWARAEADRKTDELAAKAETAAKVADRTINLVNEVIDQAERDLAEARRAPAEDPTVSPWQRLAVNRAAGELPGGVDRAREAVGMASEAVVVADSFLSVFAARPEEQQALGVRPEQLEAAKVRLSSTSAELRRARSLFGVRLTPMKPEEIDQVQQALSQARRVTGDVRTALDVARTRVEETRQKAHAWTLRIALAATALGSLGALGQVFLARACWRGLTASRAA